MPDNELTPPVDATRDPPMHEMDWQRFERLTVDLFSYEPGILTSDDYGVPGQTDHGVDVIARRSDGEEVASCKVREEVRAKDLAEWSDNFLARIIHEGEGVFGFRIGSPGGTGCGGC